MPAAIADRWELSDKQDTSREDLGRDTDGARRYRISFDRPVVDQVALRFRYRLPLAPGLQASTAREVAIPWISLKEEHTAAAKAGSVARARDRSGGSRPGMGPRADDGRIEPASDGSLLHFVEEAPAGEARPFTFKALALEPVPLPSCVVPRLLIKDRSRGRRHDQDGRLVLGRVAWARLSVRSPRGSPLDRCPSRRADRRARSGTIRRSSEYRLRFPGDVGARPVLVELEYQESGESARDEAGGLRGCSRRSRPADPLGNAPALEPGDRRDTARLVG